jgi:Uma2 family endonuclease
MFGNGGAATLSKRCDKGFGMNEALIRHPRPTTRAAEGLPRWSWSVSEIERLSAGGYFREDDRFELVGGEIVPMSPKGRRHEVIRVAVALRFSRGTPESIVVASEAQFNLAEDTYTVPDVLIHPTAIKTPDVCGKDALLVVEVAETSLSYDRGMKARLYALHGVREYWVINATTLVTAVHTSPSATGYREIKEIEPSVSLSPTLVAAFAISLGTIDVD